MELEKKKKKKKVGGGGGGGEEIDTTPWRESFGGRRKALDE